MDPEAIVGLGSAGLAVIGAVASGLFSGRANRQAHELARQARIETEVEAAERILEQFRDPLLDAAQTLQARLYNIVEGRYFDRYLHCGDPDEERYARDYTLFAIAEYLCWSEIVRRELRFLDLGDVPRNRQLLAHLAQIQLTFQTDKVVSPFKLFRGRQRAIAELMRVPTGATAGPRTECVGYATFCLRLRNDDEFSAWFTPLAKDVDVVARSDRFGNARLVRLQRDLVDMIDFLDPMAVRVVASYRARMTSDPVVEQMPTALDVAPPAPAQGRRHKAPV